MDGQTGRGAGGERNECMDTLGLSDFLLITCSPSKKLYFFGHNWIHRNKFNS